MHIRNAFFGQPFWANQNWQRRAEISSAPADGIGCGTPEEDGFGLFQSVFLVDQADGGRRILVVSDEHIIGRKLCKTDYNVSGTQTNSNTCTYLSNQCCGSGPGGSVINWPSVSRSVILLMITVHNLAKYVNHSNQCCGTGSCGSGSGGPVSKWRSGFGISDP